MDNWNSIAYTLFGGMGIQRNYSDCQRRWRPHKPTFLDKTPVWCFGVILWLAYAGVVVWSSLVGHKVRQLHISRTVLGRISKFYKDIHTDLLYSYSGYDATSYFWSEVIAKNCRKRSIGWFPVEFVENSLCENCPILHAYRGLLALQTCQVWLVSCFRSAAKCTSLIYFRSAFFEIENTAKNSASDVLPAPPIGGVLVNTFGQQHNWKSSCCD